MIAEYWYEILHFQQQIQTIGQVVPPIRQIANKNQFVIFKIKINLIKNDF
jgi:hypothetical protein